MDETSINVKKGWMYLYRSVDSEGKTLEFLLSPTRDAEAAKAFFLKTLHISACSTTQEYLLEEPMDSPLSAIDPTPTMFVPRVINVDKNAPYPKAIAELTVTGILPEDVELRHVHCVMRELTCGEDPWTPCRVMCKDRERKKRDGKL